MEATILIGCRLFWRPIGLREVAEAATSTHDFFFFFFFSPLLWWDAFPMATHNSQSRLCTCHMWCHFLSGRLWAKSRKSREPRRVPCWLLSIKMCWNHPTSCRYLFFFPTYQFDLRFRSEWGAFQVKVIAAFSHLRQSYIKHTLPRSKCVSVCAVHVFSRGE